MPKFSITFPETVIVIGPAGGGKTTLIDYVCEEGAGPKGDNVDAMTLEPTPFPCHKLGITFLDTRGSHDTKQSDSQTASEILMFLREYKLQVCNVFIFITDNAIRAHSYTTMILTLVSSLHPDMRKRVVFWVTSLIPLSHLSKTFPDIPAIKKPYDFENDTYHFDVEELREYLKPPLPLKWELDECSKCGKRDDQRVVDREEICYYHTTTYKDHDIMFGISTETTRNVAHDDFHPGHWRGLLYGFTWSCCGRGEGSMGCRCRKCGTSPHQVPFCETVVIKVPGSRSCTRSGCPGLSSEKCKRECILCNNSNGPGCQKGKHEWVHFDPHK